MSDTEADTPLSQSSPSTEMAPVVRKRPKPGERRLQILQTLATMLEQPGAERITTAALAARLFSLVNQIVDRAQAVGVPDALGQRTSDDATGTRQAANVVLMLMQFAEKNPGMTRVMVGDALVFENERLQQRMNQFFDKIEATFRQSLRADLDFCGGAFAAICALGF